MFTELQSLAFQIKFLCLKKRNGRNSALLFTLSANFGISTTPVVRCFFSLGPFSHSHCLTPCFLAFFRGLPWFLALVFPRLPVVRRLRFGHPCRLLFRPSISYRASSINRLFPFVEISLFLIVYCGGDFAVWKNVVHPRFLLARLRSFIVKSRPSFLSFFSIGSPVFKSQSRSL